MVLCGIYLTFRLNVRNILHNTVNLQNTTMGLNNVILGIIGNDLANNGATKDIETPTIRIDIAHTTPYSINNPQLPHTKEK
jgi:hypothetical protein